MNVLFVCTGNTCRSPMAAAAFAAVCRDAGLTGIGIDSAGLSAFDGDPLSRQALRVLESEGAAALRVTARALTPAAVRGADIICAMTASHRREICRRHPEAAAKTRLLSDYSGSGGDIPDPFGGNEAEYRRCLELMRPALACLLSHLRTLSAGDAASG